MKTVKEIQKVILNARNLKRPTINNCLLVLGASRSECYNFEGGIYNYYQKAEIVDWVHYLYRQALVEYHPDKHPDDIRVYTEICQELGKSYLQALEILGWRG
jgi:hypothetical protein